jgi:hypothetical protein
MKFILFYTKDQGQEVIRLADEKTRMIIGSAAGPVAAYGVDAREAIVRTFIDDASALAWLKEQARGGREDVDFLIEKQDDRRVVELGSVEGLTRAMLGKVKK